MSWTKERHEAVRVRCAEATPGPWATYDGGWRNHARAAVNPWRFMHVVVPIDGPPKYPGHVVSEFIAELKDAQDDGARRVEVDAAFIAAARTDLPDALAEIERQAAEIEKAQHDLRIKSSLYEMALKDIDRLTRKPATLAAAAPTTVDLDVGLSALFAKWAPLLSPHLNGEQLDDLRGDVARALDADRAGLERELADVEKDRAAWRIIAGQRRDLLVNVDALLRAAAALSAHATQSGYGVSTCYTVPAVHVEALRAALADHRARGVLAAEPARTDPLYARVLAEATQTDANRGGR